MQQLPDLKSALFVGHPGHELRAYGWLEKSRPLVFVLTDGSARTDSSRVGSTTALLNRVKAKPGSIYGRFTDAEFYDRVLARDEKKFIGLVDEFAATLVAKKIELVCGDAIEGYIPTHDLCRYIANAAIEMARNKSGRAILNYDFLLTGPTVSYPPELEGKVVINRLEDEVYKRKLKAGREYPELKDEVSAALSKYGMDAFRVECFRPVDERRCLALLDDTTPEYEERGKKQITAGNYAELIRYTEHVKPIAVALWEHATKGKG